MIGWIKANMRLDSYLSMHHNVSRNRAKQLIEAWLVFIDGDSCTKVSQDVSEGNSVTLAEDKRVHWVSRSAMKLHGFLAHHQEIAVQWMNCLDVGSSTGGFTEVLLEQWAKHIDAVDVGTDQLHEKIRSNSRVKSYEQTDIRAFFQKIPYDVIVCDASFISLCQILDAIIIHANPTTEIILLFKPQFEVGKINLRKTGVPKDEKCILEAMNWFENLLKERQCAIFAKEKSCLIWEAGNEEWVYWIRKK
jgi:23S rRNA (cytidine1920-2'-O)/16S rRNA (cytidine1409-2'-O)-methyltransferase